MEFKVLNEQLPAIRINFEELKAAVQDTMTKYTDLVITTETLTMAKTVQRDLAGMRIKIDTYRKDKKKELSKPIEAFENQCKELVKLIEETEKPIKEGIQTFDDKKREEKRTTAQLIINHSIQTHELTEKYASQLTVIDKYMNLTATAKDVTEDVEQRAFLLKEQQDKEIEMLEIIKDTIENANKNINAKLSMADFQRLINAGTPTKDIIQDINSRAERIKAEEIRAEELRVRKELEAKEAEELRVRREQEAEAERIRIASLPVEKPVEEVKEVVPVIEKVILDVAAVTETMYITEIRVIGNLGDMKKLGAYLKENFPTYQKLKLDVME